LSGTSEFEAELEILPFSNDSGYRYKEDWPGLAQYVFQGFVLLIDN
jgi:hypothetical protein